MTPKKPVPTPHLWWNMSGIWKIELSRNLHMKGISWKFWHCFHCTRRVILSRSPYLKLGILFSLIPERPGRKQVLIFFRARNLLHWGASFIAGSLRWMFLHLPLGLGVRIKDEYDSKIHCCQLTHQQQCVNACPKESVGRDTIRHLDDRPPTLPPLLCAWV